VTQVHMHMPLLEAVHYAQIVTLPAQVQSAPCLLVQRTQHDIAVGLGLPLEMPLAIRFSCSEWI